MPVAPRPNNTHPPAAPQPHPPTCCFTPTPARASPRAPSCYSLARPCGPFGPHLHNDLLLQAPTPRLPTRSYAYVLGGLGLTVFDVTKPAEPKKVARVGTGAVVGKNTTVHGWIFQTHLIVSGGLGLVRRAAWRCG